MWQSLLTLPALKILTGVTKATVGGQKPPNPSVTPVRNTPQAYSDHGFAGPSRSDVALTATGRLLYPLFRSGSLQPSDKTRQETPERWQRAAGCGSRCFPDSLLRSGSWGVFRYSGSGFCLPVRYSGQASPLFRSGKYRTYPLLWSGFTVIPVRRNRRIMAGIREKPSDLLYNYII